MFWRQRLRICFICFSIWGLGFQWCYVYKPLPIKSALISLRRERHTEGNRSTMKLSIIIPCYNEEKNISKLVSKILELQISSEKFEVIFVENGSLDQTGTVLSQQTDGIDWMRIVTVPINKGYGYGIKQGLAAATGDYLGWLHADLQFSPHEIKTALELLEKFDFPQNIFLKGRRTNRPFVDRFFTLGMSLYETILLRCSLFDINAQPCIFSRDLYMRWTDMAPDDFSLDLYAYYMSKKSNAKVVRWKVRQYQREVGASSWNTGMGARWKLIKRTVDFSYKLKASLADRNT